MSGTDDLFEKARKLSGNKLEQFLSELTEERRNEIHHQLNSTIVPDPNATIEGETDEATPRFTPSPKKNTGRRQSEGCVPSTIGPYRILQPVGKGGMGQVFMAEQLEPVKRRVALKVISTDTPTDTILARFEAERQALAMMDHQNIAKVLDAGRTEDGRPYFAMELVRGVAITEYCDTNRLAPKERLDLFVQTCRAIQHAHQKGIIHRDLKPSNVLVTLYDGKPVAKVIDFGLAKAMHEQLTLTNKTLFTQYGQVLGTLEYMSPEQADLNALDIDTRTDVYSLGVILYELLTGSTPIGRERLRSEAFDRILAMIREEEAPRPSARLSGSGDAISGISDQRKTDPRKLGQILRGDLDWIAVKALEKDRSRRYDGAAALGDDVERFLSDEPIEARPPTLGYRLRKSYRRHKAGLLSAAAIVGLLVAGLLGTGLMWRWAAVEAEIARNSEIQQSELRIKADQQARRADREASAAKVSANAERKAKEELEASLARSNYFLALARWEANRTGEAIELLERVPDAHRHVEWDMANHEFAGIGLICRGHQGAVNSVQFSLDGSRVASASDDGTVRIWDSVIGKELLSLLGHIGPVTCACFSPDGTQIVSGGADNSIKLWDALTGQELRTLGNHPETVRVVLFSPDGHRIASGCDDGMIKLWDTATAREVNTWRRGTAVRSIGFSPDSSKIATGSQVLGERSLVHGGSGDGAIQVWDALTGEEIQSVRQAATVTSVSFSPDGAEIGSASQDRTISLWASSQLTPHRRTDARSRSLKGHTGSVNCMSFSPDSIWLATASDDTTIRLWDTVADKEIRILRGHVGPVTAVDFSPNAERVVSGSRDNTVRIWELSTGDGFRNLRGHTGPVTTVSFSADGSRLASGSHDCTIRLWDTTDGEEVMTFGGKPGAHRSTRVFCVSFSPDTRRIASGSYSRWVMLWNTTGGEPSRLEGHRGRILSVAFGTDGRRLVSGSNDGTVKMWDAETREEYLRIDAHVGPVTAVCISSDGNLIASCGLDRTIKFWDSSTGQNVRTLTGHTEPVTSLSLSRDMSLVASGSRDRTIKLWDVSSGQELNTLIGHQDAVSSVSFNPDGTRLLSGSHDQSVKLWDVSDGQELRTLGIHSQQVLCACFSTDAKRIASASSDGEIRLWDWSLKGNLAASGREKEAQNASKASPKVLWHEQLARQAEANEKWFAAAFHWTWVLKLSPDSEHALQQLHSAYSKLDETTAELAPNIVREAIVLPKQIEQ